MTQSDNMLNLLNAIRQATNEKAMQVERDTLFRRDDDMTAQFIEEDLQGNEDIYNAVAKLIQKEAKKSINEARQHWRDKRVQQEHQKRHRRGQL